MAYDRTQTNADSYRGRLLCFIQNTDQLWGSRNFDLYLFERWPQLEPLIVTSNDKVIQAEQRVTLYATIGKEWVTCGPNLRIRYMMSDHTRCRPKPEDFLMYCSLQRQEERMFEMSAFEWERIMWVRTCYLPGSDKRARALHAAIRPKFEYLLPVVLNHPAFYQTNEPTKLLFRLPGLLNEDYSKETWRAIVDGLRALEAQRAHPIVLADHLKDFWMIVLDEEAMRLGVLKAIAVSAHGKALWSCFLAPEDYEDFDRRAMREKFLQEVCKGGTSREKIFDGKPLEPWQPESAPQQLHLPALFRKGGIVPLTVALDVEYERNQERAARGEEDMDDSEETEDELEQGAQLFYD